MKHIVKISMVFIGALMSLYANARMIKNEPVGEIPFVMANDGRIYVTAFVNGSDSLRFLVDTGASSIVLNTKSGKLKNFIHKGKPVYILGTTGEKTFQYSNDNSVKVGSIHYDKVKCFHIPHSPGHWDGILGLNGLTAFNIEINYDDHKIYFYPKKKLTVDNTYISLPLIYKYNVPCINLPVRLNGTLYHLLLEVDTGSDRIIDLNTPFVNKNREVL